MFFFRVNRGFRASAYQPEVGLFLAGGGGGSGWTNTLEMSPDNAQTFQYLTDVPYSTFRGIFGSCLVIADNNTLVVIGGRSRINQNGKL